jgi:hypothetical protein
MNDRVPRVGREECLHRVFVRQIQCGPIESDAVMTAAA